MSDVERGMRFGYLISEIELSCRRILTGKVADMPMQLTGMDMRLREAYEIAFQVSREALDKTVDE